MVRTDKKTIGLVKTEAAQWDVVGTVAHRAKAD